MDHRPESFVVAAPFPSGETAPLLGIAGALVARGHTVTVIAASRFADRIPAGAEFAALRGTADVDDRRLGELFPERLALAPGPDQLNFDHTVGFVDPMRDQYAQLQELLQEDPERRLIANALYFGALPAALGAPGRRPHRWVSVFAVPLWLSSEDTTFFGPAPVGPDGDQKAANRAANAAFAEMFAPTQAHLGEVLSDLGATEPVPAYGDAVVTLPDRCAVLTVPGFDFERTDAPDSVRWVGIIPPSADPTWTEPDWWSELDSGRPVVVVTQGTVANHDLTELVAPALEALADRDVLVVAALGREVGAMPGPVPANVRVAEFVPFSALLPRADLFITNGGHGATQQAIAAGVPAIVAGLTEDKPAVAARVAAHGLGVDLQTGRPSREQIARAVDAVLGDATIAANVRRVADVYAQHDALAEIERLALD